MEHEDDDLTWGVISEAMEAEDPIINTRSTSASGFKSTSRHSVSGVGASSSRRREPEPEEKEFDSVDESEKENAQINYESYGEEEEEFIWGMKIMMSSQTLMSFPFLFFYFEV